VKDFFFMFAINATLLVGSYRIFKRLEPTFAENV